MKYSGVCQKERDRTTVIALDRSEEEGLLRVGKRVSMMGWFVLMVAEEREVAITIIIRPFWFLRQVVWVRLGGWVTFGWRGYWVWCVVGCGCGIGGR